MTRRVIGIPPAARSEAEFTRNTGSEHSPFCLADFLIRPQTSRVAEHKKSDTSIGWVSEPNPHQCHTRHYYEHWGWKDNSKLHLCKSGENFHLNALQHCTCSTAQTVLTWHLTSYFQNKSRWPPGLTASRFQQEDERNKNSVPQTPWSTLWYKIVGVSLITGTALTGSKREIEQATVWPQYRSTECRRSWHYRDHSGSLAWEHETKICWKEWHKQLQIKN